MMRRTLLLLAISLALISCTREPNFDVVLRNGLICDGTGSPCTSGGVAIRGDKIAKTSDVSAVRGSIDIDVHGQVVAPGFINMMSSHEGLFADGRGLSDLLQGVTLEVFGEGESMGPLTDDMRSEMTGQQSDIKYDVTWHSLNEGLEALVAHGVSPNIASFIGAATPRINVLGRANRAPTPAELDRMLELTAKAMEDGALGVASDLMHQPGPYAKTDELVALAKVAAKYKGIYISHLRNEGDHEREAVDELIAIARQAHIPAEIYHFKVAGAKNWNHLPEVLARLEAARAQGLQITADMYNYPAGATGLNAAMPPWVQEGGLEEWRKRLQDPAVRKRVRQEMHSDKYDNEFLSPGSPDRILLIGFKSDKLKPLTSKTLAEVASMRHSTPEDTAMDLVVEDDSRVEAVYFDMSEDNIPKQIVLPWMSFGSDYWPEGVDDVFLNFGSHPRAFGNFARVFARYVRDEKLMTVAEAVRKMTSLPASNLGIANRGQLGPGYFADIAVFDPTTIQDHATFEKPRQLATGVSEVFVNGVEVVHDGVHTGAKPGRVVKRGRN
jgi:N-acyl-D-amino-acid deacylase